VGDATMFPSGKIHLLKLLDKVSLGRSTDDAGRRIVIGRVQVRGYANWKNIE